MRWQKLGNIFSPQRNFPWMVSHAANPFAEILPSGLVRVYFTSRDDGNRSYISYLDLDMGNRFKVIDIAAEPVLGPGPLGTFDDSGTAMGYLLDTPSGKLLYYLGWNLKVTVPWLNSIGLATFNHKTKKFEKAGMAPIMDRSNEDPYSISYPSVLFDKGIYKMWYGSNLQWGSTQSEMNHVIKYAESDDARFWRRTNAIHVNLIHPNEYALSKPFVVKTGSLYRMWYSFRGNGKIETYRIGYAESTTGIDWQRRDEAVGIDVSASGWDSEMICYPHVFNYDGKTYMLYNGNGYGKSGFGIALLQND